MLFYEVYILIGFLASLGLAATAVLYSEKRENENSDRNKQVGNRED